MNKQFNNNNKNNKKQPKYCLFSLFVCVHIPELLVAILHSFVHQYCVHMPASFPGLTVLYLARVSLGTRLYTCNVFRKCLPTSPSPPPPPPRLLPIPLLPLPSHSPPLSTHSSPSLPPPLPPPDSRLPKRKLSPGSRTCLLARVGDATAEVDLPPSIGRGRTVPGVLGRPGPRGSAHRGWSLPRGQRWRHLERLRWTICL